MVTISAKLSSKERKELNEWTGSSERIKRILIDNRIPPPIAEAYRKVITATHQAIESWEKNPSL